MRAVYKNQKYINKINKCFCGLFVAFETSNDVEVKLSLMAVLNVINICVIFTFMNC